MLNRWGAASGQTYEIFPQVISLDGERQAPNKCPGYTDLFKVIANHSALANRDVIVLARTGVRYAKKPIDIDLIQSSISKILDKRRKRNSRTAIDSCTLMSMDSYHIPVRDFRALEYDCEEIITAGESSHVGVTPDYEYEVSPADKILQEKTNSRAKELRVSLDSPDGDTLRQLVMGGYIPSNDPELLDLNVHNLLNNARAELKDGGAALERVVRDTIENIRTSGFVFPEKGRLASFSALSFSRRSPGPNISDGIGVSVGFSAADMNGAQHLPRHQGTTDVAALEIVSKITDNIAFLHAEAATRDSPEFQVWHAKLIVLLVLSKNPLPVAVSTLVRLGADMVIVTTILEFMRQLKCTLITANCIGYDVSKQAINEELRKLKTLFERSKVVEDKEGIIAGLPSAEMQLQHYDFAAAGRIDIMKYDEAKEVRKRVSGNVFEYTEYVKSTTRKSMMEGGKSGAEEDHEMTASSTSNHDSDKKMPAAKGSTAGKVEGKKNSTEDSDDDDSITG